MDFEQRDSDIYISAFPKSGTTWMQVILHNLVTDGDMSFEHIYDVSPWASNEAHINKTPERINQLPEPRLIKTHDRYDFFDPQLRGRFIFIYRDGRDVAESYFHHNRNYVDPDLTFEQNFETHFIKGAGRKKGTWFTYHRDWFKNKNKFPILYVRYEDLKADLEGTVKRVAQFLNVPFNDEIMARIRKHASFEYMKEHETKFGEKEPKAKRLVFNNFIRKGEVGAGKEKLTPEQEALFKERYDTIVAPFEQKTHQRPKWKH